MDTQIVIRDIHRYGEDLTVAQAIARLCAGTPVTVTVTDPAPPGGDPRGTPRPGSGIEICPADETTPPAISWGAPGPRPAADTAWFADALMLASDLAAYASTGQAHLGQAAAIGAAHGRDAARRALGTASRAACQALIARLDAGDPMVYDLHRTPALGGEHGISYGPADLAADLGVDPEDDALDDAQQAYATEAGGAFWAEAARIARDRAATGRPAPPGPSPARPREQDPARDEVIRNLQDLGTQAVWTLATTAIIRPGYRDGWLIFMGRRYGWYASAEDAAGALLAGVHLDDCVRIGPGWPDDRPRRSPRRSRP